MSSKFNWFVRNPVFGFRKPVNDTLPCRAFSQKSRTEAASLFENPHGLIAITDGLNKGNTRRSSDERSCADTLNSGPTAES